MPETAENVAAEFAISRTEQDAFALRSQAPAATAQRNGGLAREIAPYAIKGRNGQTALVADDEHPHEATLEGARTTAVRNRALRANGMRTYAGSLSLAGRRSDRNPFGI
ncbi:hypothetical protein [Ferirhizobium litorale]